MEKNKKDFLQKLSDIFSVCGSDFRKPLLNNGVRLKGCFLQFFVIISLILFFSLFIFPLILFLCRIGFSNFKEILADKYYRKILFFSFYQALLSSVLSLVAGLPAAYILSRYVFKLKKYVKSVYLVPFIIPSILVVLGFVIFFGNRGVLSSFLNREIHILYSFKAILLAHVFYNFPVIAILCSDALESLDGSAEESAKLSGASGLRIFCFITLPRIIPSLLSAMALVFLFCFTSFSIIMVLGGGPKFTTIEVEIYRRAVISLDFKTAGSLSLCSMIVCIVVLYMNRLIAKNRYYQEGGRALVCPLRCLPFLVKTICYIYLLVSVCFILAPVISIVFRSFTGSAFRGGKLVFNLNGYKSIDFTILSNTFIIAFFSSLIAVFLSYGLCNFRFGYIALLPMIISSCIIGLVYLFFVRYLKNIPAILVLSVMHGVINLPFAYKTICSSYKNIPKEYGEWAELCSVSGIRYLLSVEVPVLKKSLVSAFLFCFALSCGELNSTLIFGASRISTVPVTIMRMISSYNYQGACALGVILIILSYVVFLFVGGRIKQE